VIEMGEEEEILGLDYPHESSTFSAQDVDVGHFLCGGAGLDALSLQDLPEPEIEDEPPSAGHYIPPMPTLASISTLWDNLLCLCDIPHCGKKASSKCAACLNAFYCGDEHQRLDWDNHWHQCSPFIKSFVTSMEGRGVVEGMVSTRVRSKLPCNNIINNKPKRKKMSSLTSPVHIQLSRLDSQHKNSFVFTENQSRTGTVYGKTLTPVPPCL